MKRIHNVQRHLDQWEVDFLIVDHPVDLYYLTGQVLSAGRLMIDRQEATLYVDGRYYASCKAACLIPVVLQAKDVPFPTFAGKRMGFDAHTTTYEAYEKLEALKGERIPLPSPMQTIRMLKDPEEIARLRAAADLGSKGFDFVVSKLSEGVTEKELALELELFWRREGGEKVAFDPHIAFGSNSAYPHYHVGDRALQRGDCVLIDIGVVLDHYHSDMTRVVFFGEAAQPLDEVYACVREAQSKALDLCKPGTPLAELDRAARDWITECGYGENFLHSLGHGVGLEIHEAPWVRTKGTGKLQEGMVLTIEPGIYLEGIGGIRLEDTVAITPEGYENLTNRPILSSLPCL